MVSDTQQPAATSGSNLWTRVVDELDDRIKIRAIAEVAGHKTVPIHKHSIWYYFGGISLLFFAVQMVTGILLLFHYEASIEQAWSSVFKLNNKVEFGQLIRSMHSWSANLMVGAVLIHMFSAYFMKAYRKPRELTWLTGSVLLLLTITLGFTGYLLPWDEIAYFATKVGLDIAEATPWAPAAWNEGWVWPGQVAADIMRGGPEITNLTIQRFFGLHVVILPWLMAGVLGLHLVLVQLHGNTIPESIEKSGEYRDIKFFPNFFYEDMFAWLVMFNVLAVICVVSPWGLGPEADTLMSAPQGIHPEWYFMAPFEILKWMPPSLGPINGEFIGIGIFGAAALVLVAVPFWDNDVRNSKLGKVAQAYGVVSLLGLLVFTWLAYWCLDNKPVCNAMHDFFPWIVRSLGLS